jgi:hypothetical protein
LWDNITTNTDINVQNRYDSGTGHGWSGANMVIWNSKASDFYVQNPPTAQNWLIGSTGSVHSTSQYGPVDSPGYYDANNTGSKVILNGETSLYREQLNQRIANPNEMKLEYWVGDFDNYANDGASDQVAVDPTWLAAVHGLHPSTPTAGFDTPLTGGNIDVPFTMNFDVPQNSRITSATLTMAVHAAGSAAANDRIWLESTTNSIGFNQLGTLPHYGNSDIVTLEFLGASLTDPLSFLQDGKLNVLVGNNHVDDWADLQFTSAPVPLLGDFNRDNHVNTADVATMLAALTDLNGYAATNGLSKFDLLAIGDLNHDGVVNNADLQSMLAYLASGGGSGTPAPEPGCCTIYTSVSCLMLCYR